MLNTDLLFRYESGELDFDELIDLFQSIYDSRAYEWLQGHYGRVLHDLVDEGYITL